MNALPTTLFIACTLGLYLSFPERSSAQAVCIDRASVINKLEKGYGESFAGGGLQTDKIIYEVWFSEEKGTWTLLMTKANGMSCIMASGTNWRKALPKKETERPPGTPG